MIMLLSELKKHDSPIINLGPSEDSVTVKEIAECVRDNMSPQAKIIYGSENRVGRRYTEIYLQYRKGEIIWMATN